ncbi:hypothetical protein E2C01_098154 [Portunus trituberculatus]|uniref:Uncharacterized protein n=1 Tax=Portunus trituberculatus TaxID=210409 RepID=A0A5B7KDB0_PORTR|nr:hypothetical protein [Portunus trituberculatus]
MQMAESAATTTTTTTLADKAESLVHDVEVHAGRLLSSQVFLSKDVVPSHEEIRLWYDKYKKETCHRAAAVLLSAILEFYRLPSNTHLRSFNLLVMSTEHVWRRLFLDPATVTCDTITADPWNIPTLDEIVNLSQSPCISSSSNNRYGMYKDKCIDIAASQPRTFAPAISRLYSASKYNKNKITSSFIMNFARAERLYKIASSMLVVVNTGGVI